MVRRMGVCVCVGGGGGDTTIQMCIVVAIQLLLSIVLFRGEWRCFVVWVLSSTMSHVTVM